MRTQAAVPELLIIANNVHTVLAAGDTILYAIVNTTKIITTEIFNPNAGQRFRPCLARRSPALWREGAGTEDAAMKGAVTTGMMTFELPAAMPA